MNSFLHLIKAFMKSIDMSHPMDKGQKIKVMILSVFSICCIFLPVLIIVALVVKIMTESLVTVGLAQVGIKLMLHLISFFTIIFGINVIFSEFFFSGDIEFLLPWPLRPWQIVGAKFVSVFCMENIMQFMFVISCIIGYGLGAHMGVTEWILSLLGIVTLPILPLAYCGIISILLMGCTRFVNNKDVIHKFSVAILFAFLVIFVASIGSIQNLDLSDAITEMAQGNKNVLKGLDLFFPNVSFFVTFFTGKSISALLGYVVVNVIAVGIMLLLAEKFYYSSVVRVTSSARNGKSIDLQHLLAATAQQSVAKAYFMKEVRILVRTPAFFTNCISINFIWPVFVYAMYKVSGKTISLEGVRNQYASGDVSLHLLFVLGGVGIAVLLSALNSISSNAISREGKHFSFMKYIPVSYALQWNVKTGVGILFSGVGVLLFYIPACLIVQIPVWHILLFSLLILMAVCFVSYMGIYIDSIQPKLVWDDELSSLRENYNSFFAMAIAIAFVAIFCVGGYFVFHKLEMPVGVVALILACILLLANVFIVRITIKSGAFHIEKQEEM